VVNAWLTLLIPALSSSHLVSGPALFIQPVTPYFMCRRSFPLDFVNAVGVEEAAQVVAESAKKISDP
jgi:hypothetical protein